MAMEGAPLNPQFLEEQDSVSALFQRRIDFRLESKRFESYHGDRFRPISLNRNPETPQDSASSRKSEKPERMDCRVDPEISFKISFRRIGAGLRNLGNTCFLNSVLQCLTYTEPLAAYLESGKHQNSCRMAGFCALCSIQKHVSRALQSTGRILEPKDLVSNLRCISRNFRNSRQEDAHEYLVNLLESMHKCCLPSGVPSESPSAYEKSLVHRIFGGYLRSQVKCMQCSFCSNKLDPFLDLSLEIVKADSVKKALSHFTSKELLDGGAKQYQCQRCKQKVKALKQLTVHKAPRVLALHLKRFSEHDPGRKINKDVTFEPTLDLKPFVSDNYDGDLKYTLYGVLVHAGWNTHSGHYYCFIRKSSGIWYSLDDNQVFQVSERSVLNQKAYILFYFRDGKASHTKQSEDSIKKGNMVLNPIGNAASSKFGVELKQRIQSGSVANEVGEVVPQLSDRSQLFASAEGTNLQKDCAEKSVAAANSLPVARKTVATSTNCSCATVVSVDNEKVSESKEKIRTGSVANKMDEVLPPTVSSSPPKEAILEKQRASSSSPKESVLVKECAEKTNVSAANSTLGLERSPHPESLPAAPQTTDMLIDGCNATIVSVDTKEVTCSELKEQLQDASAALKVDEVLTPSISDRGSMFASAPKETNIEEECAAKPEPSAALISTEIVVPTHAVGQNESAATSGERNISEQGKEEQNIVHSMQSACLQDTVVLASQHAPAEPTSDNGMESKPELFPCSSASTDLARTKAVHAVKKRPLKHTAAASSSIISRILHLGPLWCNRHKGRKRRSRRKKDSRIKHLVTSIDGPSVSGEPSSILSVPTHRNLSTGKSRGIDVLPEEQSLPVEESLRKPTRSEVLNMLDETHVLSWEDSDVAQAGKTEAPSTKPVQIGYVGDEWDDEYDRGKRKRIRNSRILFGGPNLLQNISNRNLERKRAKLQHSSSADNRPFRIDEAPIRGRC